MVNYNYLGYGTTDSNGIAKLEYDANGDPLTHSYTGTGAGEIDIVASLDNPIASGSIQSERCEVLDCIYYDDTTSDSSSNYYLNTGSGNSISYSDGYYTINYGSSAKYVDIRSLTDTVKGSTVTFEADVVTNGNTIRARIVDGNSTLKSVSSSEDGTFKVENVELPSTTNGITFRIEVTNDGTVSNFKFKNWKIYIV